MLRCALCALVSMNSPEGDRRPRSVCCHHAFGARNEWFQMNLRQPRTARFALYRTHLAVNGTACRVGKKKRTSVESLQFLRLHRRLRALHWSPKQLQRLSVLHALPARPHRGRRQRRRHHSGVVALSRASVTL